MAKKCFLYLLQVILRKSKRNFFYALLLSFPIFALLLIGFLLNSCLYILYRTVSILQSFKSSLLAEDRVFKTLFLSFYSEVPITTTAAEFLYPVRLGHTNQIRLYLGLWVTESSASTLRYCLQSGNPMLNDQS